MDSSDRRAKRAKPFSRGIYRQEEDAGQRNKKSAPRAPRESISEAYGARAQRARSSSPAWHPKLAIIICSNSIKSKLSHKRERERGGGAEREPLA